MAELYLAERSQLYLSGQGVPTEDAEVEMNTLGVSMADTVSMKYSSDSADWRSRYPTICLSDALDQYLHA